MSKSPDTLQALRTRQDADWRRFLFCRSAELAPGGKLLTAFVLEKGPDNTGWEWLGGQMWEAMRDLVDANVLTPGELSDVVVPAATRRMEDITKTFEPDGRFEGLALDGVEVVEVPDPIWERYERTGDALELGEAHANSLRAWSGPSIAECLSYRPDCGVIVDRLFARVAERLSALPKPHRPYLAVVSLSKA